jgi:hypothetical protein
MATASNVDLSYRPLICARVIQSRGRIVQDRVCLTRVRRKQRRGLGRPAGFILGVTLALLLFAVRNAVGG